MRVEPLRPPPTPLERLERLEGRGLFVPDLQPEPFPLRRITPAPCTQACPAGVQVKAYVSLIAEERFAEALEVIRKRCPLPGICGRVCHHPCEVACLRGRNDEPIAIRALKRFVADREREFPRPQPPPGDQRPEKIAVVGSGPAGLTAAYDLRLAGFPVTVFESQTSPGGMLRHGITAYRLPREILDEEIEVITRAGVEIQTGIRIGTDLDLEKLPEMGYRAVLLALGAQLGRHLGIPDEGDHPEVQDALAFLRRVNAGDLRPIGRRILVIGGGSTAVEAARTAKRLGADSVQILYRRSQDEVLASAEEVEAAEQEGVRFRFLVAPTRVLTEGGHFLGLECAQVGLGERDASGRRRPIIIPGTEFRAEADRVLAAVGQQVDLGVLPSRQRTQYLDGTQLYVDESTSMTRLARVFAAGDMVTGPSTVIHAIAGGHRAAESIRHLIEEGQPGIREERPERRAPVEYELPDPPPLEAMRIHPEIIIPKRGREFAEVEQCFRPSDAVAEARRCRRCGPCGECKICAPTCGRRHVMVRTRDWRGPGSTAIVRVPAVVSLSLHPHEAAPGWVLPDARPSRTRQVDTTAGLAVELLPVRPWVNTEHCRACASCVEVCPFEAIEITNGDNGRPHARIERSLCRGCNLCTAVCPTLAAVPSTLSPEWWGHRLADAVTVFRDTEADARDLVILACQRRAGALEPVLDTSGIRAEVIRFRCVGQANAGMLLDLLSHGCSRVMVAGCTTERCRFGSGAELAAREVERARAMLELLGHERERISTDWSGGRANDRLEEPIAHVVDLERRATSRPATG